MKWAGEATLARMEQHTWNAHLASLSRSYTLKVVSFETSTVLYCIAVTVIIPYRTTALKGVLQSVGVQGTQSVSGRRALARFFCFSNTLPKEPPGGHPHEVRVWVDGVNRGACPRAQR